MEHTLIADYFQHVPHSLRTSMHGEDQSIIMFQCLNGCGFEVRKVPSPAVPWLVTVFITTADDRYFQTSINLTRQQAAASAVEQAKQVGSAQALYWFMACHGRAGDLKPTISTIMDCIRQYHTDHQSPHLFTFSNRPQVSKPTQLSLF